MRSGLSPDTDSERYPQGPYPDGGGEADSPNHCDRCGIFLHNPLTSVGYGYVNEVLEDWLLGFCPDDTTPVHLFNWAAEYQVGLDKIGKAAALALLAENRFEIVEAVYAWCSLNHTGQYSAEYELLCHIGKQFHPGSIWNESRVARENVYYRDIEKIFGDDKSP